MYILSMHRYVVNSTFSALLSFFDVLYLLGNFVYSYIITVYVYPYFISTVVFHTRLHANKSHNLLLM